MTKFQMITLGVSTLMGIAIFALAYQSLVVIPQNRINQQAEQVRTERIDKVMAEARQEEKYNSCMVGAHGAYVLDWNTKCELLGKESECAMNGYESERTDTDYKEAQARCVTMYK